MEVQTTLDQLVLGRGLLTAETFARAQLVQQETGERLDAVLTRLGLISEQALAHTIADETGYPIATAEDFPQEPVALDSISTRFLRDVRAVPLEQTDSELRVALTDTVPTYPPLGLSFAVHRKAGPWVGRTSDVEAALQWLYGSEHQPGYEYGNAADEADIE